MIITAKNNRFPFLLSSLLIISIYEFSVLKNLGNCERNKILVAFFLKKSVFQRQQLERLGYSFY